VNSKSAVIRAASPPTPRNMNIPENMVNIGCFGKDLFKQLALFTYKIQERLTDPPSLREMTGQVG